MYKCSLIQESYVHMVVEWYFNLIPLNFGNKKKKLLNYIIYKKLFLEYHKNKEPPQSNCTFFLYMGIGKVHKSY